MRIGVENFRSFDSTDILDFNDLNVFIGKNSSGKSSLLRFFPLMKQTFSHETSEPILWYSPEYVDFGEFDDVVGSDKNKPITFKYNFKIDPSFFISTFANNIRINSSDEFDVLLSAANRKSIQEKELSLKIDILKDYIPKITLSILGSNIEIISNKRNEVLSFSVNGQSIYTKDEDNNTLRLLGRKRKLLPQFRVIDTSFAGTTSEKQNIHNFTNGISSELNESLIYPMLNSLMNSKEDIQFNESHIHSMLLPIFLEMDRNKMFHKVLQILNDNPNRPFIYEENEHKDLVDKFLDLYISSLINKLLLMSEKYLSEYFSRVIYIAPLRASVMRYYRMQGISVSEMDSTGANIPMIIANMRSSDLFSFQRWTKENFGFKIQRQPSHGHTSVLIQFEEETPRNIIDLGFGYSQLLPIIVAIWSTLNKRKNRLGFKLNYNIPYTIVIEQPELHLHPAMQADFIDVCIKIIQNNANKTSSNIRFIIETHSEAIINRIVESIKKDRLHYREPIIHVVNSENNKSDVQSIRFDEDGDFLDWPIGFFSPESIKK